MYINNNNIEILGTDPNSLFLWATKNIPELSFDTLKKQIENIYGKLKKINTLSIEALIQIALQLTTPQTPQWRIVAARFLIIDIYKQAQKNRNYSVSLKYGDYLKFLEEAVNKNLYAKQILNAYSKQELSQASLFVNPDFDLNYDYAGMTMLVNRYLIKDRKNVFELPQEMYLTIALLLAANEKNEKRLTLAYEIYLHIATNKISLATPILSNLRKPDGNLSSCFIAAIDDNLESIFYNINSIAKISKNGGGVGVNLSRVRSAGSDIRNIPNTSGGVIPWIKIINDTAIAVNQLGKRAGAVTTALDIWHADIEDFLELQTENGDQRKKAYDLFPQVVILDLFMKRVKENKMWTLLDPHEVKKIYNVEIATLYGEKFEIFYKKIEHSPNLKLKKTVSAKELFIKILKAQIETGMPYLFFKDTANKLNPNFHDGFIGSGNLCQESFSNFSPSKISASILKDGKITTDVDSGFVHTCNLVSLNLANLINKFDLEIASKLAVKILDNTIDLTISPIQESNNHNSQYRTIGVGAMGLADYLAIQKFKYSACDQTLNEIDNLFEFISYNVILESINIAHEKGKYNRFENSAWDNGIILGRNKQWYLENSNLKEKWNIVFENLEKYGIRNSQLLAIAPNTSSALVQNCTASVLPIFSKFFIDKNAKGAVPICPPYIDKAFWYYKENKNIDQKEVVSVISTIQKWIDQGISFELLYNLNSDIKAIDIFNTIFDAWEKGCKTIYYTRTIQKDSEKIQEKAECVSCAN